MTRPGGGELGTALLKQALADGTPAVLDAAIEHLRIAVDSDVNALGWQANLGAALRTRYRRTEKAADLDEAIDVLRRAVVASEPADPWLVGRFGNLGVALRDRAGPERPLRDTR